MTDLPYIHSASTGRLRSIPWNTALYAAAAAAGISGLAITLTAQPGVALEWQLVLLLRFMAVMKAAMVLGALGLTHWRLRQPIGDALASGYIASLAVMLVAPGLIWSLAHIALGAGLFHVGLFTFLILAWRDDAAGKRLSAASRT